MVMQISTWQNTLDSMMSEISHMALLTFRYTNNAIRATRFTVMDAGVVTGSHKMKVFGHRSE